MRECVRGRGQHSAAVVWGGVPTVAAAATAVGIRPKVTDSFLRWRRETEKGKKVKGGQFDGGEKKELKEELGKGKEGYCKGEVGMGYCGAYQSVE